MKLYKLSKQIIGAGLILLVLVGCVTPAAPSTPIPPTNTHMPIPPTATSSPIPPTDSPSPIPPTFTSTSEPPTKVPTHVFTLVSSIDEILGTWSAGNYYIRFDSDGTFRQAHALDDLDSLPYAVTSYQFEGSEMVITEVSVSGVPSCGSKIGRYEIRLLENGSIQIVTIKDQCPPRAGDIARTYKPVP